MESPAPVAWYLQKMTAHITILASEGRAEHHLEALHTRFKLNDSGTAF